MIRDGNKIIFVVGSELIYDQTSVITSSSRKIREKLSNDYSLCGVGTR